MGALPRPFLCPIQRAAASCVILQERFLFGHSDGMLPFRVILRPRSFAILRATPFRIILRATPFRVILRALARRILPGPRRLFAPLRATAVWTLRSATPLVSYAQAYALIPPSALSRCLHREAANLAP